MSRKMKLDFTGVESFQRASEGKHAAKIATADMKQSQGGNDMIVVSFEVTKGDDKGARVYENYPLVDTALWKLKGLLQAIGMKADGKVQLDLDKLIGKACEINVFHEEWEGKVRAKIESVSRLVIDSNADDDDDDDFDEDEQSEPKKSGKKAPMNKPEPEDSDDEDDDDWDDEDDEDEKPAKPAKTKAAQKSEAKKPAKKAEPEEDDDDDWDDDDWDEE